MLSLILLAMIELTFGLIKIMIGLSLIGISTEKLKQVPILKYFIESINDDTLAGHMYEYVLFVIGIYSVLSALTIFGVIPPWFIEKKYVELILFISTGLFMVVFYSLVLYTRVPISKNMANKKYYVLLGLIGGIVLALTPVILQFLVYIVPVFHELHIGYQSVIGTMIFIILISFIEWSYLIYKLFHGDVDKS